MTSALQELRGVKRSLEKKIIFSHGSTDVVVGYLMCWKEQKRK